MSIFKYITVALFSSVFLFSCGVQEKNEITNIYGEINGEKYINDFLGIEIPLPEGWMVYDYGDWLDASKESLREVYEEDTVELFMEFIIDFQVTLLEVYFKNPDDSENCNITFSMCSLKESMDYNNPAEYLQQTYLEDAVVMSEYDSVSMVWEYDLNGHKFAAITLCYNADPGNEIYEDIYAFKLNGYIIMFQLIYFDEKELVQLREILSRTIIN